MAGKCRRYLQFVSEANPIEGGPIPSQTQQIKVAAFCGQVYPCQRSPLETINGDQNFMHLLFEINAILLFTINNKYTAQTGEQTI